MECLFVHWFPVELEFEVSVFWAEKKENGEPGENPLEKGLKPTTTSTYIWRQV